jgi:hypothetical protein
MRKWRQMLVGVLSWLSPPLSAKGCAMEDRLIELHRALRQVEHLRTLALEHGLPGLVGR